MGDPVKCFGHIQVNGVDLTTRVKWRGQKMDILDHLSDAGSVVVKAML